MPELETEVKLLKKELQDQTKIHDRLDVAIEKLKTGEFKPKRSRQFIQQTTNVFTQKPRTGQKHFTAD